MTEFPKKIGLEARVSILDPCTNAIPDPISFKKGSEVVKEDTITDWKSQTYTFENPQLDIMKLADNIGIPNCGNFNFKIFGDAKGI